MELRRAASTGLLALTLAAGCGSPNTAPDASDGGLDATRADAAADTAADADADAGPDAGSEAGDAGAPCSRTGARPASEQPPPFAGPSAPVDVYRDALGVPHIFARTDADAVFASGYLQAVDRLFEMDLMRRLAAGTQAEVLGPDKLSQDQMVRMVNIPGWARASADRMRAENPARFELMSAWVAGVNRRVAEVNSGAAPLPPGFRPTEFDYAPAPWTTDDAIAVGRLLLFSNANQLEYDLLSSVVEQYVPAVAGLPIFRSLTGAFVEPPDERPTLPGDAGTGSPAPRPPPVPGSPRPALPPDFAARLARFREMIRSFRSGGSNNWAVAGVHTDNGRPLLAGDPHQALQLPSVFWAQQLNSADAGGSLDVAGFGFAGAPGVHLGHNRRIAWTATTTYPDMMDLFDVPTTRTGVTVGAQTFPLEHCVETINVRGQAPVAYAVDDVPGQGVLLPRDFAPVPLTTGSHRILFRWTGFAATDEAATFFGLDTARSVAEAEAAIDLGETSAFNFIVADATDIAYRVHVRVPDRGDPATMPLPYKLLDGTDPRAVWTGAFLPDDKLPHSHGGARGFLASANNDPFGFTADYDVRNDPWYYGVWFDPGTRAGRIESELSRLTAAGGVTRTDMQTLQMDTHSEFADRLLPPLLDAYARVDADPALAAFRGDAALASLVAQLAAWDRRAVRDSSAAVVFEGFAHFFARRVLADDMGILFDPVLDADAAHMLAVLSMTVNRVYPEADQFMQEGRDVLALTALADTRDWLAARFGGTDAASYRWDAYHRTVLQPPFSPAGPFALPPVSTNGSIGTVNVSQAHFFDGDAPAMFHESHAGAAYRMVVSFADDGTPVAEMNFPPGNSGDPNSPEFDNTLDDWATGTYRPLLFDRAEIEAAATEHVVIAP